MSAHTNHQIVRHNGIPVAVVIPYAEYEALIGIKSELYTGQNIPHEVISLTIKGKISPIAAWREHLGLTQDQVATRMGITQATYAKMESVKVTPRISTLKRVAVALGITIEQLDW